MIGVSRTLRLIDRNEIVVDSEAVALSIAIREKASLKHFVRRKTYAINYIGGIEGRLLDLGEKVFRVAVQFKNSTSCSGKSL